MHHLLIYGHTALSLVLYVISYLWQYWFLTRSSITGLSTPSETLVILARFFMAFFSFGDAISSVMLLSTADTLVFTSMLNSRLYDEVFGLSELETL